MVNDNEFLTEEEKQKEIAEIEKNGNTVYNLRYMKLLWSDKVRRIK